MKLYWSTCARDRNAGDQLGPALLAHYAPDLPIEWARGAAADVVACGSIIEAVPDGWAGTVLNAGTLYRSTRRRLAGPVLSLRGPLTAAAVGVDPRTVPLGDLGVLATRLPWIARTDVEPVVVAPHYADRDLAGRYPSAHHVKMTDPLPAVVGTIATADRVISSSLHALIIADAFGVPHRWEPHPRVAGDGHKFADYAAAVGTPIEPDVWRVTPRDRIRQVDARLDETIRSYVAGLR